MKKKKHYIKERLTFKHYLRDSWFHQIKIKKKMHEIIKNPISIFTRGNDRIRS